MNASARFVTFVPLFALAAIMWAASGGPWTPMKWAGLILALFGFTLLTIARLNLGNSFSVTPQARALVTNGIYAKVRHPVYVFSLLGIAGLILYLQAPWFLLLLVPVAVMQVLRARAEERVLEQRFGDQYRAYRRSTWI